MPVPEAGMAVPFQPVGTVLPESWEATDRLSLGAPSPRRGTDLEIVVGGFIEAAFGEEEGRSPAAHANAAPHTRARAQAAGSRWGK